MDELIKALKHFALPAITGGFEAVFQQGFSDALVMLEGKMGKKFGAEDFSPFGSILYWDNIHKAIKNTNQALGISGNLGNAMEDTFQQSTADIKNLGLSWESVADEYKSFIEDVGRNRQLTSEELVNLAEVKAVYGSGFSDIFSTFSLLGVSINQTSKDLQNATKEANKLGISTSQIIKELKTNLNALDKFNFNTGRKGLMEMARLAVETKISMASALGFADKIWEGNIEGAIEMGAELQLLGGEFAMLGDPFELFYQARNAPEEFMKSIQDATESVAFFNKETGEIDIDAQGFSQLRALSKATGISLEELSKSAKMGRTEAEISGMFDSSIQNAEDFEKVLTKVAGAASFDSGKWQVNVNGMTKAISELTKGDIAQLSVISEDTKEGEIYTKIVTSNESLVETMQKLIETLKLQIIPVDLYKGLQTKVQVPAEQMRQDIVAGDLGWIGNWLKGTFQTAAQNIDKTAGVVLEGNPLDIMKTAGGNVWDSITGVFSKILKPMIVDPILTYLGDLYKGSWMETIVNGIVTTVNTLLEGLTKLTSAIGDLMGSLLELPSLIGGAVYGAIFGSETDTTAVNNLPNTTDVTNRNNQVSSILQNQPWGMPTTFNANGGNTANNPTGKNIVTIPIMYNDGTKTTQIGVIDPDNTKELILNHANGDSSAGFGANLTWKKY